MKNFNSQRFTDVFEISRILMDEEKRVQESIIERKKAGKYPTKTQRSQVKKLDFVFKAIENVNTGAQLQIEGVRGNSEKRYMFNVGSFIETLIKHYRKGYMKSWKSANARGMDERDGIMDYEIKCSLANARCTVPDESNPILFVNHKGVYLIKKSAIPFIEKDKKGKLYENKDYSQFIGVRKIKSLSEKMGL